MAVSYTHLLVGLYTEEYFGKGINAIVRRILEGLFRLDLAAAGAEPVVVDEQ